MEKIRLQKLIAESGLCSRRRAEEYIRRGRVRVNGRIAKIGESASPDDAVTVDGERLARVNRREFVYLMLHKPRGYVVSMSDKQGGRCVLELLSSVSVRVFPVGRLDKNSEGLLLFTNDGAFANGVTHPSGKVSKTYRVTVRPGITDEQLSRLSSGVEIDGKKTLPAGVLVKSHEQGRAVLQIVVKEGRNRQVRKMCEAVGLEVARLKRTAVGPLKLGMLRAGEYRELTADELRALRTAVGG
jgi:23S rRNA pseudouridine2605 synthase